MLRHSIHRRLYLALMAVEGVTVRGVQEYISWWENLCASRDVTPEHIARLRLHRSTALDFRGLEIAVSNPLIGLVSRPTECRWTTTRNDIVFPTWGRRASAPALVIVSTVMRSSNVSVPLPLVVLGTCTLFLSFSVHLFEILLS